MQNKGLLDNSTQILKKRIELKFEDWNFQLSKSHEQQYIQN